MENLFEAVGQLQQRLKRTGVDSVVIGGLAVAIWGEPRLTADADIKVSLSRDRAAELLNLLQPDYTFLANDPSEILRRLGILFIQNAAGLRLDLLLADTPFDVQAIRRGQPVEFESEQSIIVCTPEDLILYKLISIRSRDREDVKGVIRRQGDTLDDTYLLEWLRQFEQALDDATLVTEYRQIRHAVNRKR